MRTDTHSESQTLAEVLDLSGQALDAVLPMAKRLGENYALTVKRQHNTLADYVAWKALGANEAELMRVVMTHVELVRTLYSGPDATSEHAADRAELEADVVEDHVEGMIYIEGETPELLDKQADALETQASTSLVKARIKRRRARALRTRVKSPRDFERSRLGLGAA